MCENHLIDEVKEHRKPEYPIKHLILNRWSPRSMTGESLTDEELMPLFEAARWSPSSFNNQPWRFLYAKRDTENWPLFFDLLVPANQLWAKNAAVLVVVISKKTFDKNGKPSKTHTFDTGSAWLGLALEATARHLVTHGMEGFDYDRARTTLEVPEDYQVEAMIAIGKRAPKDNLPDKLKEYEKPSQRKALKEIIMEGKFRKT